MATGRRRTLVVLALLLVGVVTLDTVSRGVVALWSSHLGRSAQASFLNTRACEALRPRACPRPGRRADV